MIDGLNRPQGPAAARLLRAAIILARLAAGSALAAGLGWLLNRWLPDLIALWMWIELFAICIAAVFLATRGWSARPRQTA